jgi:hypothetical protein
MSEKACPECNAIFSIKNEVVKRVFLDEETVERISPLLKDNMNRYQKYNVRIKYYEDTIKTTCDKCEYELVYTTNTTDEEIQIF